MRRWRVAAGVAALHLAIAALALVPSPYTGGDNAVYVALARSLLGGGYRDGFDPAAPVHAQFPPGWPAMLAGAMALGVKPWVGTKYLTAAFSALAVGAAYLWIRRRRRPRLALGVAALMAVSPGVLALSHSELSEVPFCALLMTALLLWERRGGRVLGASLAVAAAYLTRSAGLPLLVAAGAWLAWRRRWRDLGVYAAVVMPAYLAWAWWRRAYGGAYAGYVLMADPYAPDRGRVGIGGLAARVVENAGLYGSTYLPRFLAGTEGGAAVAAAVALVALAAYGWARRAGRPGVAEIFTPLYLVMVLLWPVPWSGERFILPIFPILVMYAGDGAARLGRMAGALPPVAVPAAAGVALALVSLPGTLEAVENGSMCRRGYAAGDRYACMEPQWKDFFAVADTAARNLPKGSAVLSRKPALFHAASGVPGRTYPLDRTPEALLRTAREAGARYVLLDGIDNMAEQYLAPVLIRRPQAFCVMYSLGPAQATLFGVNAGAERMPDLRDDPGAAQVETGFKRCGAEFWRAGRTPDSSDGDAGETPGETPGGDAGGRRRGMNPPAEGTGSPLMLIADLNRYPGVSRSGGNLRCRNDVLSVLPQSRKPS